MHCKYNITKLMNEASSLSSNVLQCWHLAAQLLTHSLSSSVVSPPNDAAAKSDFSEFRVSLQHELLRVHVRHQHHSPSARKDEGGEHQVAVLVRAVREGPLGPTFNRKKLA